MLAADCKKLVAMLETTPGCSHVSELVRLRPDGALRGTFGMVRFMRPDGMYLTIQQDRTISMCAHDRWEIGRGAWNRKITTGRGWHQRVIDAALTYDGREIL